MRGTKSVAPIMWVNFSKNRKHLQTAKAYQFHSQLECSSFSLLVAISFSKSEVSTRKMLTKNCNFFLKKRLVSQLHQSFFYLWIYREHMKQYLLKRPHYLQPRYLQSLGLVIQDVFTNKYSIHQINTRYQKQRKRAKIILGQNGVRRTLMLERLQPFVLFIIKI